MGDAIRKLKTAGHLVEFDLTVPHLTIARSDQHTFAIHPASVACETCDPPMGRRGLCDAHYNPALVQARCIRMLIGEVVRAAFSGQMGRADGKIYAALLEELDSIDDGQTTLALTLEIVRWLLKLATKEDIKINPGLCQWREVFVGYLESIVQSAELEAATQA